MLMAMLPSLLYSQKKQITQAQDIVKSGKNLDKAEASMRKLLQDSVYRDNKRIWLTLISSLTAQYEQANEKMYLKQKYDTTAFFALTKRMFDDVEAFDSIESKPDKKGRVQHKYRERHAENLDLIRMNLYFGGTFYIRHGEYDKALNFLNEYISCKDKPLFSGYDYAKKDTMLPRAAYWVMYCGNKLGRPDLVLNHSDIALADNSHTDYTLQCKAEAFLAKKDTTNYLKTLRAGFNHNTHFPFFFPRLIEYYNATGQLDSAMVVVNQALNTDSTNVLFRTAQSTILLNQRKYDDCISVCKQLISEATKQ